MWNVVERYLFTVTLYLFTVTLTLFQNDRYRNVRQNSFLLVRWEQFWSVKSQMLGQILVKFL